MKKFFYLCAALVALFMENSSQAGTFELGVSFSYSRNNISDSSFSYTRRWTGSVGYYLTESSEIELSYEDAVERTRIDGYQDTTFHDKTLSASWVQALTGKDFPLQPFVRGGIGQLNREATGTYAGGVSPPATLDSVTIVLGAGLRLFLTREFVIRSQVTSYLQGGNITKYKDNIATSIGLSFYF